MNLSAQKILVIDDDASFLLALQMTLTHAGYSPILANHGELGLRLAAQEQPSLILCDLRMPAMDGFTVLGHLRANSEMDNIPLIFLTGSDEDQDVIKGLNNGAEDYIVKPFRARELIARIKAVLRRFD